MCLKSAGYFNPQRINNNDQTFTDLGLRFTHNVFSYDCAANYRKKMINCC